MSFAATAFLAIIGLVALTIGADWLVRGSSRLAAHFGVSPLLIGLTVVAYGTSAPEIVASVVAAMRGYGDVTVGNVLGSNAANIGLILGGTAVLAPLAVAPAVLRRELPLMVAVTVTVGLLATRLQFGRVTGVAFLVTMVLFNYLSIRWARTGADSPETTTRPKSFLVSSAAFAVFGLGLLLGGAHLLVSSAVTLARGMGLNEFVIGVTLVAVGTSLPELATSLVAGLRKEVDLVVGNIVGSNLFNLLGALGLSAAIRPLPVEEAALHFEFPYLVGLTLVMALFLYTGKRLVRWEGVGLLLSYAVFIALLFR